VTTAPRPGDLIADRYCVQARLGKGGMGVVYRVRDERTGQPLALKRLLREVADKQPKAEALFQREYYALAHLRHPHVVQVYDYDVDLEGPFYTMELLDGQDLRQLAPVPWRQACELLRDVCSSLALLHSRRLVHRDIAPRNVRCTTDGKAKLIDFGAMAPMGPSRTLVGTPPFVAPEVLTGQPLDGRADLYAVGGLAYWMLTGRYAYPAKQMRELRELWRSPPPEPRSLVPDLPRTLSELVMALMSLDALARPASAAEVIDRLTAIADLPRSDQAVVERAYLTTPNVVGRRSELIGLRKRVLRLMRRRGGSLLIEGPPGVGRSRLLSGLVLEAKLAGALVLHAESQEAGSREFAVARALVDQILMQATDEMIEAARPYAAQLASLSTDLAQVLGVPRITPLTTEESALQLKLALRNWLCALSQQRPLVLAVDDLEACDESTAVLLAHLVHEAYEYRILIGATVCSGATPVAERALEVIRAASESMPIGALGSGEVEALLGSMFGQVPNLQVTARWIHELSAGNPRVAMELAQHLVERELARHRDGVWTLPPVLHQADLPGNLEEAITARIEALAPAARALGELLALARDPTSIPIEAYCPLLQPLPAHEVFAGLDALVANRILVGSQRRYLFESTRTAEVFRARMDAATARATHLRLAQRIVPSSLQRVQERAHHTSLGGHHDDAVRVVSEWFRDSDLAPVPFAESGDVLELAGFLEAAIEHNEQAGGPPRLTLVLRKALLLMIAADERIGTAHVWPLLERLRIDTGLVHWEQHAAETDPIQRIGRCLEQAQRDYDASEPGVRCLNPIEGITQLALCVSTSIGVFGGNMQTADAARLPELLAPFRMLAPAVDVAASLVEAGVLTLTGRRGGDLHRIVAERLEREDVGLDALATRLVKSVNTYYLGMDEALRGLASAHGYADQVARDPMYADLAWLVHMLSHLYLGEAESAARAREQMELAVLRRGAPNASVRSSLIYETVAYAMSGNLMQIKRLIPLIEATAKRHPGWQPYVHIARGHYHRERAEYAQAHEQYVAALALTRPGGHTGWTVVVTSYVMNLVRMGEVQRAFDEGQQALATGQRLGLHEVSMSMLEGAVSVAQARCGDNAAAARRMERVLEEAAELGLGGLPLGYLYECRARVAMYTADAPGFEHYAQLVADQFRPGRDPVLAAKYSKLMDEARSENLALSSEVLRAADIQTGEAGSELGRVRSRMEGCGDARARAREGLQLVTESAGASGGYLFALGEDGLYLAAKSGGGDPPDGIDEVVEQQFAQALGRDGSTEISTASEPSEGPWSSRERAWRDPTGRLYRPVLLDTRRAGRAQLAGVLMLQVDGQVAAPSPAVVAAVSEVLVASGDVPAPLLRSRRH
jgi:hypothetical protein